MINEIKSSPSGPNPEGDKPPRARMNNFRLTTNPINGASSVSTVSYLETKISSLFSRLKMELDI